jgi:hypothetical protein
MNDESADADSEILKRGVHRLAVAADHIRLNQGLILARMNQALESPDLKDYEFKVFSQWGEDGIIQRLTAVVPIAQKTFIEFGVEDFSESNSRFLLLKDSWRGFVIDGSSANIKKLKKSELYWRSDLTAVHARITRENINGLLAQSGFDEDLGLLSIDLDGIDYFVLEAIDAFRPRILICEYNALFGPDRAITVPYDAAFARTEKHFSNLYWGASLGAIAGLAGRRGYRLVGTNSAGNNAFFVREDLMDSRLRALGVAEAFTPPSFRESRDEQGKLTHLNAAEGLALIRGLLVLNVETGALEPL